VGQGFGVYKPGLYGNQGQNQKNKEGSTCCVCVLSSSIEWESFWSLRWLGVLLIAEGELQQKIK